MRKAPFEQNLGLPGSPRAMASDGSFELPLRNIAGEDCARLRVTPATKLSELRAMAAAEMVWSDYLLTLLHEHQPLTGDTQLMCKQVRWRDSVIKNIKNT
jgi:hypothetical protein